MKPSRIVIACGMLGTFALGLSIGLYCNEPVSSSQAAASGEAQRVNGGTGPAFVNGFEPGANGGLGADGLSPSGAALVAKFWGCLTMPDETERQQAWLAMLGKLTKEDAIAVRELFLKMDRQGRRLTPEWEAFWPRWGMVDGAGALEYLKDHENESWRPVAAEKILRGWGQTNPTAAMEWLNANRSSPLYDHALRGFIDGYAKVDLDRATQYAVNGHFGGDPKDGDSTLPKLMEALTERALQQRQLGGMNQWFETLPTAEAKQAAFDHVYYRLQLADKTRALDWVGQQAAQPWRSDHVISELAGSLAQDDPQAALAWAGSLPPSPTTGRYNGLRQAVQTLTEKDPAAVEKWLAQPDLAPALRDQATAAYATQLQSKGSAGAAQWVQAVTDKTLLTPDGAGRSGVLRFNSNDGNIEITSDFVIDNLDGAVERRLIRPAVQRAVIKPIAR